jgi:hypothetical protein
MFDQEQKKYICDDCNKKYKTLNGMKKTPEKYV